MSPSDGSILAAARRARPVVPVTVNGEPFRIRVPTMAAIREYQANITGDNETRVALLLMECLIDEQGVASLTEVEAKEIAQAENFAFLPVLVRAIIEVSRGGEQRAFNYGDPEEEPPPAAPEPAPQKGAGEKETIAS